MIIPKLHWSYTIASEPIFACNVFCLFLFCENPLYFYVVYNACMEVTAQDEKRTYKTVCARTDRFLKCARRGLTGLSNVSDQIWQVSQMCQTRFDRITRWNNLKKNLLPVNDRTRQQWPNQCCIEILAGRPEARFVKKIFCLCMPSQNFKKDLILKFKIISRTCFVLMIALMLYE